MNALSARTLEARISVFGPPAERLDRLGEWFAAEYGPLLRFAYFVTGDRDAAQDLVQDAFVRIGRTGSARIEDEGFRAYARRTIANLATSRFRRIRTERRALPRLVEREGASGPDIETRDQVWTAIRRLSAQQRAVVALRFYEHMTEREIAATLGVTEGTVKKQLSRALERCRAHLGSRGEREGSGGTR
ncbi:MAG: RNA polymerase sigma factor [Actinomycetota bacterium]